MSKAEDRALEAYPSTSHYWNAEPDKNTEAREFYKQGYHQAEKDLELTWEDIKIILDIENDILRECNSQKKLVIETYPKGEYYYGEILKRFKEEKENKL
jgi:hypothetical protein